MYFEIYIKRKNACLHKCFIYRLTQWVLNEGNIPVDRALRRTNWIRHFGRCFTTLGALSKWVFVRMVCPYCPICTLILLEIRYRLRITDGFREIVWVSAQIILFCSYVQLTKNKVYLIIFLAQSVQQNQGANSFRENMIPRKLTWRARQV